MTSHLDTGTGVKKLDGIDRRIILFLVVFTLLFRLLTLMIPHTGVDERDYWFSAKRLVLGIPYEDIQHRTVRYSVIIPVYVTQVVFGIHPNVYYIAPLVVSLLNTLLMYRIGRKLGGRPVAFSAALLLVLFPYMIRAGSQIRPGIFSLLYILMAIYFFLRYSEENRKTLFLIAAAFSIGLAYEAKITNLFFVPGLVAAIWSAKRNVRDCGIFLIALFSFLLLEYSVYAIGFGMPMGRLGVILNNHLSDSNSSLVEMSFRGLLGRYGSEYLPLYWQILFILFTAIAVYYLYKRKWTVYRFALVAMTLSFLFFETFAVKSINPVVPAEPFIHRYFLPVLAPILLLVAEFLATVAWKPIDTEVRKRLSFRLSETAVTALILIGIIGSFSMLFMFDALPEAIRKYGNNPLRIRDHPIALVESYRKTINTCYRDGVPIVSTDELAGRNALASSIQYFLDAQYLDPQNLSRNGMLNIERFEHGGKQFVSLTRPGIDIAMTEEGLNPDRTVLLVKREPFRIQTIRLEEAVNAAFSDE